MFIYTQQNIHWMWNVKVDWRRADYVHMIRQEHPLFKCMDERHAAWESSAHGITQLIIEFCIAFMVPVESRQEKKKRKQCISMHFPDWITRIVNLLDAKSGCWAIGWSQSISFSMIFEWKNVCLRTKECDFLFCGTNWAKISNIFNYGCLNCPIKFDEENCFTQPIASWYVHVQAQTLTSGPPRNHLICCLSEFAFYKKRKIKHIHTKVSSTKGISQICEYFANNESRKGWRKSKQQNILKTNNSQRNQRQDREEKNGFENILTRCEWSWNMFNINKHEYVAGGWYFFSCVCYVRMLRACIKYKHPPPAKQTKRVKNTWTTTIYEIQICSQWTLNEASYTQ